MPYDRVDPTTVDGRAPGSLADLPRDAGCDNIGYEHEQLPGADQQPEARD